MTKTRIPVIKSIEEFAAFLVTFWTEISDKITFFKEKGSIADIANLIIFIDAHQKNKMLSETEIQAAQFRCSAYLQANLSRYGFSICSESYGMGDFFEQVFGDKIHSRDFRIPELFMRYFESKEKYADNLDEERVGGKEEKEKMLQDFPGGAVLCIRERGGYWQIIASIQPPIVKSMKGTAIEGFNGLRPVEIFYLLSDTVEVEEWANENAIAAVLIYLRLSGYIQIKDESLSLTDKGRQVLSTGKNLRQYELDILMAIDQDEPEEIAEAIDGYDFDIQFFQTGLYTREPAKFLWLIPYQKKVLSEKGLSLIQGLSLLKDTLSSHLKEGAELNEQIISCTYAFPSLALSNQFKEYAKRAIGASEAAQAATNAAALIVMINYNTINTGSFNTMN